MTRRKAVRALIPASALLVLAGCAAGVARTPAARPKPGYERRVDDLRSVDAASLDGRKIALDPGHGGFFRGALGVNGLTEAEVNLGVALYLRGLLEGHGAEVFLTRTDDRDFLTPADSSLRSDLAERTRIANAFGPELFISIHHNADARGAHDVNEIQTYYKLGDEGPSLDAAQSIHRYLVRNLGIERYRIMPGNYFVLRNSEAPALLTESSYITNPDVEAKLALAAKQRLEAEALFLGIADYFSRPRPVIESWIARNPGVTVADSAFERGEPTLYGRVRGAFDGYEVLVDGEPVPALRTGDLIEYKPPGHWAPGSHRAELKVRLSGAGAGVNRRIDFTTRFHPASISASRWPDVPSAKDRPAAVRVTLLDRYGRPALDSLEVQASAARGLLPRDTTLIAKDGVAWAYFWMDPRGPSLDGESRRVTFSIAPKGTESTKARLRDTLSIRWPTKGREPHHPGFWTGFSREPSGAVLQNALGTREPGRSVSWLNRDGYAVLARDTTGRARIPALPGYRACLHADSLPPCFVAVAGGALHGKRIVIDPDGGGDDPAGTGRDGTRAANLNLDAARALGTMLSAAGAEVRLTRDGDFALSDVERVEMSEAFRADRFLRIGHRAEPPRLGHYFSSAAGKRWADSTANALARLGLPKPPLAEDAQYPLQQTSCPAIYVSPARVDDRASEERLLGSGVIRAEAYAMYLALAHEWAGETAWPLDSVEVRDSEDRPVPGAAVTLGRSILLETDRLGRARFARTEPGPIEIEVYHPRVGRRTVLLDSQQGVVVAGPGDP